MPKLKPQTKQERFAKELFEKFGISPEITKAAFTASPDTEEDIILEAEAVLFYFKVKGKGFEKQECPECGLVFAYKYKSSLGAQFKCSNACRKSALAKIGITWDPMKLPEQRWGMQDQSKGILPAVISPSALQNVDRLIDPQTTDA